MRDNVGRCKHPHNDGNIVPDLCTCARKVALDYLLHRYIGRRKSASVCGCQDVLSIAVALTWMCSVRALTACAHHVAQLRLA